MPFLKQTLMWIFFATAMYLGGSSTQSSSNALQGMGFVAIIMALVCLYIIFKLMWGARGTITTVAVIIGVVVYSAYVLGIFNDKTLNNDVSGEQVQEAKPVSSNASQDSEEKDLDFQLFGGDVEDGNASEGASNKDIRQQVVVNNNSGGLVGKLKRILFGEQNQNNQAATIQAMDINPFDYPVTKGYARVVTASTLYLNGINIKMYGVDAPDISQTCANHHGAGYYCGKEARKWLQDWINNREVSCHILGEIENGWATGACFVDDNKYDVAAVVVNAGWAVAYTKNTAIYVDYERQAKANRRGLWAGTFYKPWDWRKIQNRKVDIKINYPKPASKKKIGGFDFRGLF